MDILTHLGRQKIRYTALIFGRLLEIYLGKAPIMASGSFILVISLLFSCYFNFDQS